MGRTVNCDLFSGMKLYFLFFSFLLLLAPAVFSFDCSNLGNSPECLSLNEENEDLIANLIYTDTTFPNHDLIHTYNSNIEVNNAPENTQTQSDGIISNAWFSILTISPSIMYNEKLYSIPNPELRSEYGYSINLPTNYYSNKKRDGRLCKKKYYLQSTSESLKFYLNGKQISDNKQFNFNLNKDSTIKGYLNIKATAKVREYEWDRYCCKREDGRCVKRCYDCEYDNTKYETYSVNLKDEIDVALYQQKPKANFKIIENYYNSNKGILDKDNSTNVNLLFPDSYFTDHVYAFNAEFIKKPFYLLRLRAEDQEDSSFKNLIKDNNTLYVKDASSCTLTYSNFFDTRTEECGRELTLEKPEKIQRTGFSTDWDLLIKLIVFGFINYFIYVAIKQSWGKVLVPVGALLLFMPTVLAAESCGLTNLASCIPQKMYDFFINLLNAPLKPLLYLVRTLLETPPSIDLFQGVWIIIAYIISMFYGLLIIYSGFQFIFSGHNVIRREMAKDWLKNTLIMMVLIEASFYLYKLVLELGSAMTTGVLSLVDEHFFLITADNIINIGLEFLFVMFYVLVLFITIIFLVIRYLVVAFGVLFVPIGIFCYFIPPLKSYGRLILHMLGMFIFITFLDAIIILASSMLIEIPLFENIKILVMISCFTIIIILFKTLTKHIISTTSFADSGEKVAQAVKYMAMFA